MAVSTWLRVADAVTGLAEVARRFRPVAPGEQVAPPGRAALGQLETRLAGVLVAALKEAFDRDRARLDLERDHVENERRRAEELLRLERVRQEADRLVAQVRLIASMALVIWVTSALFAAWQPAMRESAARWLLAGAWVSLVGSLSAAFVAHNAIMAWLAASRSPGSAVPELHRGASHGAMQWLLVAGLALAAGSVIASL